jgi:hypothetical protein
MASQKNILKYLCSEKIIHNAINEGCHINFYGPKWIIYCILAFPLQKLTAHPRPRVAAGKPTVLPASLR